MKIGSHVSMSKGLIGAAEEAFSYGANTFMIYTGAPQNTRRKPVEQLKVTEGYAFTKEHGFFPFVVHAPYIINLASYKEETFSLAKSFLKEEISRTEAMGSEYLILHPGSFTEKDLEYGINRIIEGLDEALSEDRNVTVLLETMSGKGSEVGRNFEEIKAILDGAKYSKRLGVCFDTCHTHDSGYDIKDDFDNVIKHFDDVIGLDLLKVFHINGSLNVKGAKKDRHANLGAGAENPRGVDHIGFEAIYNIVHHPLVADRYFILETPWLDEKTNLYKEEIAMLRA